MKKVLLYGLSEATMQELTVLLEELGALVHWLKNEELHEVLLSVLEKDEAQCYESPKYPMTVCIFAGYDKDGIYEVIDHIRAAGLQRPVFATVTKNNIRWKIGQLITDVNMEHAEMQKMSTEYES